jgi:hypothetical protein
MKEKVVTFSVLRSAVTNGRYWLKPRDFLTVTGATFPIKVDILEHERTKVRSLQKLEH